jgi:small subunit ribosomal protein S17
MPKKIKQGSVVSDKMDKTVVVKVVERKPHKKYKKIMHVTKNYKAHDEGNVCGIGDTVTIVENRPLAGSVRWTLKEIVEKAK